MTSNGAGVTIAAHLTLPELGRGGLPAGLQLTPHSASANLKTEFKKLTSTSVKKKRTKPEISSSCNS